MSDLTDMLRDTTRRLFAETWSNGVRDFAPRVWNQVAEMGFLPRLVGCSRALEMLWTGDAVDAETALRIGLVNHHVAPAGQSLNMALDLARRLALQPPHAVSLIKRLVHDGATTSLRAHLDTVSSHMAVVEDSSDFEQRVQAFKARKRLALGS